MTAARRAAPALLAAVLLAAVLLGAGCAQVVRVKATGPVGQGGEGAGARYLVDKLSFEIPESWTPSGDARRLTAVQPDGLGRLDVQRAERTFSGEAECLSQARAALEKGTSQATDVRLHPTTFAGRKGIATEGDQGGWHGWAWGICDGPVQYRVSFWGATPLREDVLAAWTGLSASARFEP